MVRVVYGGVGHMRSGALVVEGGCEQLVWAVGRLLPCAPVLGSRVKGYGCSRQHKETFRTPG
jgi:hypothetical protein